MGTLSGQDSQFVPDVARREREAAAEKELAVDVIATRGIGDVNSDAKGSGARYNIGKVAYDLLPLKLIMEWFYRQPGAPFMDHPADYIIWRMAQWQSGDDIALDDAISAALDGNTSLAAFADAAHVFEYGRRKYAAWNWAKGMPWSVPLGCIVRHSLAWIGGEEIDPESGKPHRGHILCNLLMLKLYAKTYTEGDDRPKGWL